MVFLKASMDIGVSNLPSFKTTKSNPEGGTASAA